MLLAVIVATTMGPAPAAVAATTTAARPAPGESRTTSSRRCSTCVTAPRTHSTAIGRRSRNRPERGADGPRRFVDGQANGTGRRVTLPVARLAEYSFDRRNEAVLRASLGEDAAGVLIRQFNEAQISRTSYLRQFRDDLSVHRDRHARTAATEVTFVTVTVRPGADVRTGVAARGRGASRRRTRRLSPPWRGRWSGEARSSSSRARRSNTAPGPQSGSLDVVAAVREAFGIRRGARRGGDVRGQRRDVAHRAVSQPRLRHDGCRPPATDR